MYKKKGFREKVVCAIVSTFLIFMFADQLLLVDANLCQKSTMADFRYIPLKSWKIDNIDLTHQFSISIFNDFHCQSIKITWLLSIFMPGIDQVAVSRPHPQHINLRSGSTFVSLWKLHSGGLNETKREPDTNLPPTFLIDWNLPNQPNKITSVACFSNMQIFHACEKCRLADLKNSFYLLIFSAKNKTVSTITFNFLRD